MAPEVVAAAVLESMQPPTEIPAQQDNGGVELGLI
jgi:hypothetical protein